MAFPVARSLDEVPALLPAGPSAVTLGVFDGFHRGHRAIVEEVIRRREQENVDHAFLITFDPHPTVVTHSRTVPPILTTIDERLELLGDMPLDGVLVVPFDRETASLDYRDFIQRYLLDALHMRHLVIGYDCHFGHRRQGSPERVVAEGERRGFGVTVVPAVEFDAGIVSSTNIRNTLIAGDVARANALLGHPYLVSGRVVRGEGRGRGIGFATANLEPESESKLWPPGGVYAVRVRREGRLSNGMMNVGTAPTLKGAKPEIEVHIFDFNGELYGERLSVYCEAFLREEKRFAGVDELREQLRVDRERALAALGHGAG